MDFSHMQNEIRQIANEVLDLSQQIRINSTDNEQLRLINIKLRAAQQRLGALVDIQKESEVKNAGISTSK